jgi:pilus assembly protein CpaC
MTTPEHDSDRMLRYAGLRPAGRRRRTRIVQFAAGAVVVASLGAALPEAVARRPQTDGSALIEVAADGRSAPDLRVMTVSTQARLVFSKPYQRATSGSVDIIKPEVLGSRELMLSGVGVGRTNVYVWFEDDTFEQFLFTVQRDLSVLDTALRQIHPNIVAQIAPDRDAVVLTGVVPKREISVQAQKVASTYLEAGRTSDGSPAKAQVINLIRWGAGDTSIEFIIQDAIHQELECPDVKVTRLSELEFPGETDILILKGTVPTQTKLTQVLALASRLFQQQDLVRRKRDGEYEEVTDVLASGESRTTRRPLRLKDFADDIRIAADEAGGLFTDTRPEASRALGQLRPLDQGSSGANFGGLLRNEIQTNIGRAKALELAGGRILSFLEVTDLPQVRIDISIYEVDRTALLSWDSKFKARVTDFDMPSAFRRSNLVTGTNGEPVTGSDGFPIVSAAAPATDNADVAGLLGFLEGKLTGAAGISGDHVDIQGMFSVLENEGIARSISNPSIAVLSGELASFGVGGRVPINETSFSGTGIATGTVSFVDFGVNLAVRPLIGEDDFITLDVVPEISNPDARLTQQIQETSGTNPPTTAFAQRVLRTTSRLRDGQSLMIGGLREHNRGDDSGHTPGLNRIPLLGWLFKDFTYSDDDRDLVIVVHPVIVRDAPEAAQLWIYPDAQDLLEERTGPEAAGEPAKPE